MATMALHLKLVTIYKMLMFMAFIQHMHLQKHQLIPIDGDADMRRNPRMRRMGRKGQRRMS